MKILVEKLVPHPLQEQDIAGSGVWGYDSLSLESGKSYLVEAASGKGKTTLLSVFYGLRHDYHGRVCIDDRNISDFDLLEWSRLRKEKFSFIFQGLELFHELTGRENIILKNELTGYHSKERIEEMASILDITDCLEKKAGILSFGQQQRVAIIRALCQPFNFLLADECYSHMDRENTLIAHQLIREECRQRNASWILTSLNESHLPGADKTISL